MNIRYGDVYFEFVFGVAKFTDFSGTHTNTLEMIRYHVKPSLVCDTPSQVPTCRMVRRQD